MADDRPSDELASREPTVEDLRDLCRELNERGAKYVIVGGFAIRAAGYSRSTMDVDVLVAADPENEARVFAALATLADHAEAAADVVVHDVDGVSIPFASPRLLWRMKAVTHREKDAPDLVFLRHWFSQHGEDPPAL
jgi:hypothetical protein